MYHPLVGDLSTLTTDELHSKYGDLYKRINMAHRMGYTDAVHQLQMIMADYQFEIDKRNQKAMEDLEKASGQFKNIIDVTRH
jgi:hypothetical protein